MENGLTVSNRDAIQKSATDALLESSYVINKSYLSELNQCSPLPLQQRPIDIGADVRMFKIERVVLQDKQSVLESLTAAYTTLGAAGYSVFFFLDGDGQKTDLYIGVRSKPTYFQGSVAGKLLEESFKGHFSGSQLSALNTAQSEQLLRQDANNKVITAVTGVPALSVDERAHFMQGLERFIYAAEGHRYQALLLAEHVPTQDLHHIRLGYERVASEVSPLLKQQMAFGMQESDSVNAAITYGLSQSLGESVSMTETSGRSESHNQSQTHGSSHSTSENERNLGRSVAATGLGLLGGIASGWLGVAAVLTGGVLGKMDGKRTHSTGTNQSSTTGTTSGTSYSTASGHTNSNTQTNTFSESQTTGKTTGSSQQISLEYQNKHIEQLLKKIDQHLERVDEATRYGGWQSAAYFIGESVASSETLASLFLGLMRGSHSNTEECALTTWNSRHDVEKVLPWLHHLAHPRLSSTQLSSINIPALLPSTLVSSKELAIQLSLPRHATSGTAVVETQTFGRLIQTLDGEPMHADAQRAITLGQIHHLWQTLPQEVRLNVDHLSSHVFVSGSTGSGKSNTVYHMLDQLGQHQIPFMVIEPAKGEYKHVFGRREDVTVLTTNPQRGQLLKINPFRFPDGIHVLEHVDRLVEIFNVCWPMYSAMPAVLKEAMLLAYQRCGWDLDISENRCHAQLFPTFMDLLAALEVVIAQSAYSGEVKGNYIGALVTRVRSLTNGLNGQIFTTNEMDNQQLFDRNVVVDLSRVGAQESKALIMGVLIMRLNEHRMAGSSGMNQQLRHVTVLEEAHHILKRTSTEQSGEGANITGKAVEMLANAIAEMRTYGEGFIIADQSPNAVDLAAIRNTNTKIIMRLPDELDRTLAGKSAALREDQLAELSRLPKGVAVVYQSDWLEPVACKIAHYANDTTQVYQEMADPAHICHTDQKQMLQRVLTFLLQRRVHKAPYIRPEQIEADLDTLWIAGYGKAKVYQVIDEVKQLGHTTLWQEAQFTGLAQVVADVLNGQHETQQAINEADSHTRLMAMLTTFIHTKLGQCDEDLCLAVMDCLLKERSLFSISNQRVHEAWRCTVTKKQEGV